MQGRQGAVLESVQRIQRFLEDNTALFDAVNQSDARKRLDSAVALIGAHAVAQVGGSRTSQGETARQHQLRLALRNDHMRPIAVIASQKLREKPEFTKLTLPPFRVLGPSLTAAARDMANAAEPYTDLFTKEGLAPDFVAQLRAAADALEQSLITRGQSQGQRAGATTGLQAETTRARALIRQLDALVRPRLGANEQLVRQWEVASHIRRARTSQSATPPSTTPASGTTPTSAPTSAPAAVASNAAPAPTSAPSTSTPSAVAA